MTPYRFYGAINGADNFGFDTADIKRDGTIVGVNFCIGGVGGSATPSNGRCALLFSSADAFDLSDTSLVIAECRLARMTTALSEFVNHFIPLSIPVLQAERIYASWKNDNANAAGLLDLSIIMWVQDKGSSRMVVRS